MYLCDISGFGTWVLIDTSQSFINTLDCKSCQMPIETFVTSLQNSIEFCLEGVSALRLGGCIDYQNQVFVLF